MFSKFEDNQADLVTDAKAAKPQSLIPKHCQERIKAV
jgi:hypothetical protein